jgi:hypothetical protein
MPRTRKSARLVAMKYALAMAVLLAGLASPSSADAQRRAMPRAVASSPVRMGTGFSGFRPAFRPAPRPVRTGIPPRAGMTRPGRPAPFGGWHGGHGDPFSRPRFFPHHHRRFFYPAFYPYAFWPYVWYPPFDSQSADEQAPAAAPQQDDALASQVEGLTDEVEAMREEQASRQESSAPRVAPRASVDEKPVPTVLVYRDGHQGEVLNYAVLGQTLWVFGEETTRRVALADLDLTATKRLNDERGVEFVSP